MQTFGNPPAVPALSIPPVQPETLSIEEEKLLRQRIKKLLQKRKAVLVAHYYTDPRLQSLADETGGLVSDSLEMARFGHQSKAQTLVVCGVQFMGETAKILNPEKRVLMPDLAATCSLDIGCPAEHFTAFCDSHPDREVVVYANTSAAVKARSDWMVTSGSAVPVVRHLAAKGQKILWGPDKYLGQYVQKKTGADMILWQGACVVHEEFKGEELARMKAKYPDAMVLVHPESPQSVIRLGDKVGSTTNLIDAARHATTRKFIVATDQGLFFKLQQAAPDKEFMIAPTAGHSATCVSCGRCPWMAMNGLRKLLNVLDQGNNEVHVAPEVAEKARQSIERLLDFTAEERAPLALANDA